MDGTGDGFLWSGAEQLCIDDVRIDRCGPVTLGRYAGASALGVRKNEDAALAWFGSDWVFAVVMDAHASSSSTGLLLDLLTRQRAALTQALELNPARAIPALEEHLISELTRPEFMAQCAAVSGETAFLAVATKGAFLWCLSIGDCLAYQLHPALADLGQYAVNTRQFYQWVGQANSLAATIPAYARGVSQLRSGTNHILLLTDGLLEFGDRPYERNPGRLTDALLDGGLHMIYQAALDGGCDDGATAITWTVECQESGLMPTMKATTQTP